MDIELKILFLLFDYRTWGIAIITMIAIMMIGSYKKIDSVSNYKNRKEWYKKSYLKSTNWRKVRNKALAASGFRCSECGNKYSLQVHHLTYKNLGHEHKDDLKVLCCNCHDSIHSYRKKHK